MSESASSESAFICEWAGHSQLLPLCIMNLARCYDDYAENWLMVYPQMDTCPLGVFILRSSPLQKVGSRVLKKKQSQGRRQERERMRHSITLQLFVSIKKNLADNKHKMLVKHIYIGHLLIAFSRQQVPLFENREYDRLSFVRAYLNIQCDYMKFTHNPYERTHNKSITSKPWPSSLSLTTSASLLSSS